MKQGRSFTAVVMFVLALCMAFGQPTQQVLAAASSDKLRATAFEAQMQALTEKLAAAQQPQQQQDFSQVHPIAQTAWGMCGKFYADPSLNTVVLDANKNRVWFQGIDTRFSIDLACNNTFKVVRYGAVNISNTQKFYLAHIYITRNDRVETWAIYVGTGEWDWGPMPAPVQLPAPIAAPQPPAQQPAASTGTTSTSGTPDKRCTSNVTKTTYGHGEGSLYKCNGYTGQWVAAAAFANIATPSNTTATAPAAAPSSTATNPPASAANSPKMVPVPTPTSKPRVSMYVKYGSGYATVDWYKNPEDVVKSPDDYAFVPVVGGFVAAMDGPLPFGDIVAILTIAGAIAGVFILKTAFGGTYDPNFRPVVYTPQMYAARADFRPIERVFAKGEQVDFGDPGPGFDPYVPCWLAFKLAKALWSFWNSNWADPGNAFSLSTRMGGYQFLYNKPFAQGGGTERYTVDNIISSLGGRICQDQGYSVTQNKGNWDISYTPGTRR